MGNSKLKTANVKSTAENFSQTCGENTPTGQVAQGIAPNEKNFANSTFSLPHTALFYLFFHGASAALTIARAGVAQASAESFVEKIKAAIAEREAEGKNTEAVEKLLIKAEKSLKRAQARAEKTPELPAGINFGVAAERGFLEFSKKNKRKGFEKVELNYSAFYALASLPSNELALALPAIIFLFSQIRRVGKSWRDRDVLLECSLKDFKEFTGAGANVTTRLLRLAAAAITTARITIKTGKKQATGNLFSAGDELVFDKSATDRRAPRKRGVSLKLKPNKFLARLVERTHTIRANVARVLKSRDFLLYLELKSAQAVGFEKTILKNVANAAGFVAEPSRKTGIVSRVKKALKRIAPHTEGDFGWQVDERADDPLNTRIVLKTPQPPQPTDPLDFAPPLLPPLTLGEFIQSAALPANLAPQPPPAAHVVKLKSVGEKILKFLGLTVDF